MQSKEEAYAKLQKSKFRASFNLSEADIEYIEAKGLGTIREHAVDFVRKKLSAAYPDADGRQTPMSGHPVFKAMHATAFCCRGCMHKWYNVPLGAPLSDDQQKRIVNFLMYWVRKKLEKKRTRRL